MLTQLALQQPQAENVHVEETFGFAAAPALWVIALVVIPFIVAFSWWSYGGLQRLEVRSRVLLSTLRGLAIALAFFLLMQPQWLEVTYRKTQNQIHVLVDDSASMVRKDGYPDAEQRNALQAAAGVEDLATRTRAELVADVLGGPNGPLAKLAGEHELRMFRVQRKPMPVSDLGELTARGTRTQLGDALDLHLAATSGSSLEAVVLVSDGRNNSGLDPVEVARRYAARGIPIHTIGVGDPEPPRNAWITAPPGPKEALREEVVSFDATVRAEGLAGKQGRVELLGAREGQSMRVLTTAPVDLPDDGEAATVRLNHAFEEAGDWTLKFQLADLPEESQYDDNSDTRFLHVVDERIRVLYIEDRPRWEYRYVKNCLKRVDASIQVQAVLFDANPRFEQEHSDELPPLRDIPRTPQELMQYHVVLIGDVPPERIAPTEDAIQSWLQMLVEFVEFGGGAGFLFGDQAMPERYRNTPLQDLLPVVLEDPVWLANPRNRPDRRTDGFRPLLENEPAPHEILLLQRDPDLNLKLWTEGLPPFRVYHPVLRARPGSTVLLRHPTDASRYGKRPIAVIGPHPRGQTFFIATDETWIWRNPYGETYQDAFWRNVVRHLARGRLERRDDLLELTLDKTVLETGDKVRAVLRVHDEEMQPAAASEHAVFVRDAEGEVQRRTLRATPGEPGVFQASFTMADPGAFSFLVFANDNPQDTVQAREDVLVRIPDKELADSSLSTETLQRISQASSGSDARGIHVHLGDCSDLLAEFADRKAYESREETRVRTAWDSGWWLFALLALLGTEWIIRKRRRLI
jgi:hypothetical protein